MLFLIIIGLFFAGIVFFHMIQGFFSATLSAILTIISAVLAFSLHETIVEKFLAGKMADYIHAVILLALFGIIYLILRSIFDNVVKGNVRVPNALDKGGAVVMGVIAATFATGIMAIAAEELPFTTTIGGFSRYDVQQDREVVVPAQRSLDRIVFSELSIHEPGKFGDEGTGHGVPIIPVDSVVVGAVKRLSNGAFSNGKPLQEIHPDYLDELFGQRVGIEPGGNHVAMNLPDKRLQAMDVVGIYSDLIPDANQKDSEFTKLRTGGSLKPITLTPQSRDTFLVVRVAFKIQASDQSDHIVRFSTGSARLVAPAPGNDTGEADFVNYYPVGSLQDASILYLNKVDDFMFSKPISDHDEGVDLVYKVPKSQFEKKAPPGTFIEFKRLARVNLSGEPVQPGVKLKKSEDFNPLRKPRVVAGLQPGESMPQPAPEPAPAPTPAPAPPRDPRPPRRRRPRQLPARSRQLSRTRSRSPSAPRPGRTGPLPPCPAGTPTSPPAS